MIIDFKKFVINKLLGNMEDVSADTPSPNDLLSYNGSNWENTPSTSLPLTFFGTLDRDVIVPYNRAMIMISPEIGDHEINIEGELVIL